MTVWTIGKLASVQIGYMVEKLIINALQDPIWKVRAAALTALSAFGQ